jgi:hypothetical protein
MELKKMKKTILSTITIAIITVFIVSSIGVIGKCCYPDGTPSIPIVIGIEEGSPGNQYEFEATSYDPNDDLIYYQWDWGDGEISDWIGEYESGETCVMSHEWDETGEFTVRVRAADDPAEDGHGGPDNSDDGLVSDWGTLVVTMPVNVQAQTYVQQLQAQQIIQQQSQEITSN